MADEAAKAKALELQKKVPPTVQNSNPPRERKSILSEARPAEDVTRDEHRFRCFMVGETGSGCTTSLVTLPGKILVIDYDRRASSLAGLPNIEVLACHEPDPKSPKAWARAMEIRREIWSQIRNHKFPYDAVCEDGLSSMNRICMYWSLLLDPKRGLGGSPAQQHYGPHIKNLSDHIISMIALPVHYILTGHFNIVTDPEGNSKYLPKVYGAQMRTDIPTWFDETYLSYKRPKTRKTGTEYLWHTEGFGKFEFFKSSLNQRGKYWENPFKLDLEEETAGFKKLLDLRFGKEVKDV